MCQASKTDQAITTVEHTHTVWAISAIHSDVDKLINLHDALYERIKPGDKIVYLGNYGGYNDAVVPCLDEILAFRRLALCIQGILPQDLVYLRGSQEEMWQKLLQLQFAPNPSDVLLWMLGHGLSQTLYAYGLSPHDGIEACRTGVVGLTKWTNQVRQKMRRHGGHDTFTTHLTRAACTPQTAQYPMLFVHAGIDWHKELTHQGDRLWWGCKNFSDMSAPYKPYEKVVRGFDPSKGGVHLNCVTATLDGGCGFGGNLICAGFSPDGNITEILES